MKKRILSDKIIQAGKTCGYIELFHNDSEYTVKMYLFMIAGCIYRKSFSDIEQATEYYNKLFNEYNYQ